jgi:translocation and assembly module TamB
MGMLRPLLRGILRWTVRFVVAVVVLLVLLLGGVLGTLRSGLVDDRLGDWITAVAKKKDKFFVRAYGVSGNLPFHLKVDKVEVGDATDVYLTIEHAEATWNPLDLYHPRDDVKWKFVVERIHAERLEWTRLPHDNLPDDGQPFRWDRFPRILIGDLTVDDFDVSGTLLGGARARMHAEGSCVLGEWDHGHLKLALERIDDVPGKALIDLTTGGSPIELNGSVTGEEGEGSALGALARLTDPGAVKLDVRGSGPMRDWNAEADITTANIGRLKAAVKMAYSAAGPFELTGSFDPAPRQRDKYYVGPGAPMTLEAKGAWAPGHELRVDRLFLAADGRELVADGRLDLVTHAYRVKGDLAPEREGGRVALPPLTVAAARIEGTGFLMDTGALDATLQVDAMSLGGVDARSLVVEVTGTDPAGDSVQDFQLDARAEGLAVTRDEAGGAPVLAGDPLGVAVPLALLGTSAKLTAKGRVDLADGLLAAEDLSLVGDALSVTGPLAFEREWNDLNTRLRAESPSLEALTSLAGTAVGGKASLVLDLDSHDRFSNVDAKLVGDAAEVVIGEMGWNAVFGPAVRLEAEVHGSPRGPAKGALHLVAGGIDARAEGSLGADGRDLVADLVATLDNMATLSRPAQAAIAGRLETKASLRGSLDDFALDLSLIGDHFSWDGHRFDSLVTQWKAEGLPEVWAGEVHTKASYGKLAASLDASVSMPGAESLSISGLSLVGPGTRGSADLDLDLARGLATGTVKLESGDLSLWRPFLGVGMGGAVRLDAKLDATSGQVPMQRLSGALALRDATLALGDRELVIDLLDASAESLELGASPRGRGRLHVSRIRYGDVVLVEGLLTTAGDGRAWATDVALSVDHGEKITLDATASVAPGALVDVSLSRLEGDLAGVAVSLVETARIRGSAGGWSIAPLSLRLGEEGTLRGAFLSSPSEVRVDAELVGAPLAVVPAFFPGLDLVGSIDGRAALAGPSFAGLAGELVVTGKDVASGELVAGGVTPVDLRADARFGRGRLAGSVFLVGLTDTDLRVTVDMPLTATSAGAPLVIDLVWKGEVAEALALLPLGEDALRGRIQADLRLAGTMASPRVTGRATVEGGQYENAASGLVLTDLRALVEGTGNTLELRELSARDGDKGAITARGRLRFETLPAFEADLELKAVDAMLARLDLLTTRADADVVLHASRETDLPGIDGTIAGSVRIADARVQIPDRFIADVPELDVVEIGVANLEETAEQARTAATSLDLDLAIVADNRIFVSGRGLESEWKSDLHVRGTTADPRVEGTVSSVRGQLGLLGRRFELRSATLRFDGSAGNRPYLAMIAEAEANDITAIIDVKGPAMRPVVEMRSDPALPRDEVLSRVLFGQSAASLTPMQSVSLARSVAELAGAPLVGVGPSLLGGIGKTLGLDRLDIDSAGSDGGAALTASKYLTDSVYLRVQQGLTPETSKLSIEWEVYNNITIESDVSQDAQGEVGVSWRWDY